MSGDHTGNDSASDPENTPHDYHIRASQYGQSQAVPDSFASYKDALGVARGVGVPRRRRILGIVGKPGGGKSALAAKLVEDLAELAVYVPMDGFHLANSQLERLGRRERKGALRHFDTGGE